MAKWLVASDLKSGGPVFKSRSDHYICACISFTVDPSSTPQPRLQVMRQLVCLLPVRIFNLLCLMCIICFGIFEWCACNLAWCKEATGLPPAS